MFRRLLITVLTASLAVPAIVACAPPKPDEAVGDSSNAFSNIPRDAPIGLIASANVRYLPETNQVSVAAFLRGPEQPVRVCAALVSGTQAQAATCDDYPSAYQDIPCPTVSERNAEDPTRIDLATFCLQGFRVGRAPFDQGPGTYRIYVVNRQRPTDRKTLTCIPGDRRTCFEDNPASAPPPVELRDLTILDTAPFRNTNGAGGYYAVAPESRTKIEGVLDTRLEISPAARYELKGCAAAFQSEGLTREEIAAKDEEILGACADPNVTIEGREGWSIVDYALGRAQARFDLTPYLARGQHVVLGFRVRGVVRRYLFEN